MFPAELPTTAVEVLRDDHPRGGFKAVLFDFDGTLSLIRRGWMDVMVPMMVGVLADTGTDEPREALTELVREFVYRLNGRQTIYQMMQLADEVRARGAVPREPLEYKRRYHELLWEVVGSRVAGLSEGTLSVEAHTVPGSHHLLEALVERGLMLYLASGTDLSYVRNEVRVLELEPFFGPRVYGALDDHRNFSKAMIIEHIITETGVEGRELLAFGDGFVEIEETRRAGGLAVGVASNEQTRDGIDAWKRERLIRAGADLIIADYRNLEAILERLGL